MFVPKRHQAAKMAACCWHNFYSGSSLTTIGVVDAAGLGPDQSGLLQSKGSLTNRDLEIYIHFHYSRSINGQKLFLLQHLYRRFQVPGTIRSGSSFAPRAATSNIPSRKFHFCSCNLTCHRINSIYLIVGCSVAITEQVLASASTLSQRITVTLSHRECRGATDSLTPSCTKPQGSRTSSFFDQKATAN